MEALYTAYLSAKNLLNTNLIIVKKFQDFVDWSCTFFSEKEFLILQKNWRYHINVVTIYYFKRILYTAISSKL